MYLHLNYTLIIENKELIYSLGFLLISATPTNPKLRKIMVDGFGYPYFSDGYFLVTNWCTSGKLGF